MWDKGLSVSEERFSDVSASEKVFACVMDLPHGTHVMQSGFGENARSAISEPYRGAVRVEHYCPLGSVVFGLSVTRYPLCCWR